MKVKDLHILHIILKKLRKNFPGVEFKFYTERKFFCYITVSDVSIWSDNRFLIKKELLKKIYTRKLSKKIIITKGFYVKK